MKNFPSSEARLEKCEKKVVGLSGNDIIVDDTGGVKSQPAKLQNEEASIEYELFRKG